MSVTPYYSHAGITLYHGDCREILPTLPKVDLVLTDPPYGHGDRWSGGTWAAASMYDDAQQWDRETPSIETMALVLAAGESAIVWGGNYLSLRPSRCWLAWIKVSFIPTMADMELAWTSFDRPSKVFREHRNPDGNHSRQHPTQKPLRVMSWCLTFAPTAVSVLDPFCGSGTTMLAAKERGVSAIGIEIEEKYCEIAAKRLSQEVLAFS